MTEEAYRDSVFPRSAPGRNNRSIALDRSDSPVSRFTLSRPSVLPGFGLALGCTLLYLSLIVLIPLSAAFVKSATLGWPAFWAAVTAPRVLASLKLSFGASAIAAVINGGFGLLVAWVLAWLQLYSARSGLAKVKVGAEQASQRKE